MGFLLRWLSILTGAISLFSLAQKHYDFPMAPVISDALPYYRSSLLPFVRLFPEALAQRFQASSLPVMDFIIIYFVLGLLLLVHYISDDLEWRRLGGERITFVSLLGRLAIALLWPLIVPAAVYLLVFDANRNTLRTWVSEIAKLLASAFILAAVNACFSTLL